MSDCRSENGRTGAWGELLVSADLINKGFEVFRNLSPVGPIDLIAVKGEKVWKIQVKVRTSLTAAYPECDVLAVVKKSMEIDYIGKSLDEIAAPRQTCKATNDSSNPGWRCQNGVRPGQDYCHMHKWKNIAAAAREFDATQNV